MSIPICGTILLWDFSLHKGAVRPAPLFIGLVTLTILLLVQRAECGSTVELKGAQTGAVSAEKLKSVC